MKKVLDRKTVEPVELQVRSFKKTMITRGMEIQTELLQPSITIEHLSHGSDMPYRIVVGNNPVNWIDPWGLARGTYSISNHTLTFVSNTANDPDFIGPPETRTLGPVGVHSGRGVHKNNPDSADVKDYGPVPPGTYDVFPNEKPGREGWWSLKDQNWTPFFSALAYKLGLRRAGSNLHVGWVSHGCITVDPAFQDDYDALTDLLQKELGANTLTVVP